MMSETEIQRIERELMARVCGSADSGGVSISCAETADFAVRSLIRVLHDHKQLRQQVTGAARAMAYV